MPAVPCRAIIEDVWGISHIILTPKDCGVWGREVLDGIVQRIQEIDGTDLATADLCSETSTRLIQSWSHIGKAIPLTHDLRGCGVGSAWCPTLEWRSDPGHRGHWANTWIAKSHISWWREAISDIVIAVLHLRSHSCAEVLSCKEAGETFVTSSWIGWLKLFRYRSSNCRASEKCY